MKLKKLTMALAVAALPAFAAPAQSAVLDAWQLVINGNTYDDIGRLSLTAGSAQIQQETPIAVGARFTEAGFIFSISYVQDNVVGAGDTTIFPSAFAPNDALELVFTNVTGQVTSVGPGLGFGFDFQSGDLTIQTAITDTLLATGTVTGVGGTLQATPGISGVNGESVTQVRIDSLFNGFAILDSAGNPVDLSTALFEAVTNNQTTGVVGSGPCTFDATANCITFNVNSNGDAFLVTQVPEPGTLALLGASMAVLGFGALRRKKLGE